MSFIVEGKIVKIYDEQQITATFKKREFVIEYMSGTYPQFVKFETKQDKCDQLNNYKEGQSVKVSFDLNGREYNNPNTQQIQYFTSLSAWKVENSEGAVSGNSNTNLPPVSSLPPMESLSEDKGTPIANDDLPF
jgi:single-strand DNA-binding protein